MSLNYSDILPASFSLSSDIDLEAPTMSSQSKLTSLDAAVTSTAEPRLTSLGTTTPAIDSSDSHRPTIASIPRKRAGEAVPPGLTSPEKKAKVHGPPLTLQSTTTLPILIPKRIIPPTLVSPIRTLRPEAALSQLDSDDDDEGEEYASEIHPTLSPRVDLASPAPGVAGPDVDIDMINLEIEDEPARLVPPTDICLTSTLLHLHNQYIRGKLNVEVVLNVEKGSVVERKGEGGEAFSNKINKVDICTKCNKYNFRIKRVKGSKCLNCGADALKAVHDLIEVRWNAVD